MPASSLKVSEMLSWLGKHQDKALQLQAPRAKQREEKRVASV